jgi:hypothetical protein
MTDIPPASPAGPRINFGRLALIVAGGGVALPMLACAVLPLVGVNERSWFFHGFSWFVFDFAFPLSLVSLILTIVGLTQRGTSRRLAAIALAALVVPWLVMLL